MAYIPSDATWYLADIILEHTIEGDPRNVVHVDMHLIKASSPEEAFCKANELGRSKEMEYANTDDKLVRVAFRGLRDLNVIHDELEDGAEIIYEEEVGVPEEKLARWATPKAELGVFALRKAKTDGPNYMPESIMGMFEELGFGREELLDGSLDETEPAREGEAPD